MKEIIGGEIDERVALASEVEELKDLLAAIPEENTIERISLESRLDSVRAKLAELSGHPQANEETQTFWEPDNA